MSNPIATVLIPIAPYHTQIAPRAIASAEAQTMPVKVLSMLNEGSPARVRNLPLNRTLNINTPFLVFLDADDVLMPTFVEDCLRAYQTGKYVYTKWTEGEVEKRAASCPFHNGSYHIVTTLYPTAVFREVHGFDPDLPGGEDIDFYLRSMRDGICGTLVDKVLVLRPDALGRRSNQYVGRHDYQAISDDIVRRNGGTENLMGCCGSPGSPAPQNPGQQQPGDVLAQTLWMGMRSENGRVSGRMYIGGNGNLIYMAAEDVKAAPELFRVVRDVSKLAPDREAVLREAGII